MRSFLFLWSLVLFFGFAAAATTEQYWNADTSGGSLGYDYGQIGSFLHQAQALAQQYTQQQPQPSVPILSGTPPTPQCRSVPITPLSLEALNQIPTPVLNFLQLTCGKPDDAAPLSTNGEEENMALNPRADLTQCGTGVCDDLRENYKYNPSPNTPLDTFRLRFIVMEDRANNKPMATVEQIAGQAGTLNWAYGPVGIRFDVEALFCDSPQLRYSEIAPPTDLASAEDAGTNGDSATEGRSRNNAPSIDRTEFRRIINAPQDKRLNIYVHRFKDAGSGSLVFKAYTENFPWEGPVGDGMIISPDYFNANMNVLVHELGHIFGLLHVHHGVSETRGQEQNCNDPCYESMHFLTTALQGKGYVNNFRGDLCSDTPPTPKNYYCNEPPGMDHCGGDVAWSTQNSPYRNFMGYGPNECRSEWTEQQIARMRCWMNQSDLKRFFN